MITPSTKAIGAFISLAILVSLLFTSSTHAAVPSECKVVVIGAGVGGVYSAYRLAVEAGVVPGSNICIFEALDRPGGRIFSVTNTVPGFEDFTVDLGAYRYVLFQD